ELAVDWHALSWWRLQPAYTYLRVNAASTVSDRASAEDAASTGKREPRHQWSLRSSMTLSGRSQFDVWLRHVASTTWPGGSAPRYTTMDLRYAWRVMPGLELSVVGQNLLDRRHPEIIPFQLPSEALQIQRSLYVKAKWQF
ncbi:MAG TPA: TonB-dependent receptor, partial [Rhodocyclaceae bacterium]|nr:TonB-dependent receptor [Rhodocyclaceae bacterium]